MMLIERYSTGASGMRVRALAGAFALAAMLGVGAVRADDAPSAAPTFTRDVLPILQQNCQTCHRHGGDNYTGMVAPMSLLTYQEVRPWAKSIATEIEARRMPPWHASADYNGVFENERTMTDEQISTVTRWVRSGAPLGDPDDAPPPVDFPDFDGWRIGRPDLIVKAPRYFVEDDVQTLYINHQVTLTDDILPESRWIKAIEWKGDSSAVHHIVGAAYLPGEKQIRGTGYGLGSIAPGEEPMMFPDGHAKILVRGSTIVFSMHYHKEAGPDTGVWDESMVAFRFYPKDAKISHFVEHGGVTNAWYEIPPGEKSWFVGAAKTFEEDVTMIALHPHMHLRGKDARYTARYPDGTSRELLYVPNWDFNWQTDYSFREPPVLPAGTRLEYTANFDNSADNPSNPDPAKAIRFGQKTEDEMMIGFITWAAAEKRELDIDQVIASNLMHKSASGGGEDGE